MTMTVGRLIEALSELPDYYPIDAHGDAVTLPLEHGGYTAIDAVTFDIERVEYGEKATARLVLS